MELKRLRAFVDELASKGWFEAISRMATKAVRAVTGTTAPGLMTIKARGGMGKSTLLAKFVLDHALGQTRPFPFAYLDFDRACIDPEQPRQLLIEIARQVRLQFPRASDDLNRLIADLRAESVELLSASSSQGKGLENPASRFVKIVRKHATQEGNRAFLLVFDTLEMVQWDTAAMQKLGSFVTDLRQKGFDELKVVASGRADIQALGAKVPSVTLRLNPLSVTDARNLATRLGAGEPGTAWKSSWSAALVGTTEQEARREPLAVRVAVDLLTRAKETDRDALAERIRTAGPEADEDFVAWIYEKRIVDHVRDPLARKLAWPGLIIRRVTVEIIRDVLADLCEIDPKDADRAFAALGKEGWMVTREGDALRHIPDLRARMLPLMREHDEAKFDQVCAGRRRVFRAKSRSQSGIPCRVDLSPPASG